MSIYINKHILSGLISAVRCAVSKDPIVPILEEILLIQQGGVLTASASDLQTTLKASAPHACEDFSVLIPKNFELFLAHGDSESVSLTQENGTLTWRFALDSFQYEDNNTRDFPRAPRCGEVIASFSLDQVQEKIGELAALIEEDSSRSEYHGIRAFAGANQSLSFMVVNPIQVHCLSVERQDTYKDFSFYKKAALIFSKIKADAGALFICKVHENNVVLTTTYSGISIEMITRTMEEPLRVHPGVLFEAESICQISVQAKDLQKAVKGFEFIKGDYLRLSINGEITIGQHKKSKEVAVSGNHTGEGLVIVFNAQLFKKFISNLDQDNITLLMSGENRGCLLRAGQEERLLMPVNKERI